MGYASKSGRAITNRRNPVAHAICDRCGFRYNHPRLSWQFEYSGNQLINQRLLVCRTCLDVPQPQLKSRYVPADPLPIRDPRPEPFSADEGLSGDFNSDPSSDFNVNVPITIE